MQGKDTKFSDSIVYVDESGDHGLKNIDVHYPIFVLAFCIFEKQNYINTIVPALQTFKLKHFGYDQVVLHESDIRRDRGDFSFLKSKKLKLEFMEELSQIVRDIPMTLICTAIQKEPYRKRYISPDNPYHVALGYGLERIYYFLREKYNHQIQTHIIVEKRGKAEDNELELEFRRICDGDNYEKNNLPFDLIFSDKKSNSIGMQLADLVARPVGLHLINPEQVNRAFEVLTTKFYGGTSYYGRGLKCFP